MDIHSPSSKKRHPRRLHNGRCYSEIARKHAIISEPSVGRMATPRIQSTACHTQAGLLRAVATQSAATFRVRQTAMILLDP